MKAFDVVNNDIRHSRSNYTTALFCSEPSTFEIAYPFKTIYKTN